MQGTFDLYIFVHTLIENVTKTSRDIKNVTGTKTSTMKKHIKFALFTSEKFKKGYPIKLVVRKDSRRKVFALNLYTEEHQWDENADRYRLDSRTKGLHPDRVVNNVLLNKIATQVEDIINDFEKDNIDWTVNQFQDRFTNASKKGRIEPYFEDVIDDLTETKHIGNARSYKGALHMLQVFDKDFTKRLFSEIDLKYVNEFNKWLQKPRVAIGRGDKKIQHNGCSGNTRKYYLKSLRSILNKAIKEGEATSSTYPFGMGGFEIAKLEEETLKRYLPSDNLLKLKETEGQTDNTELARKLFMFSYYCYGISFVDMALLTSKNIINHERGQYIVYKRQKTKSQKNMHPIQIRITEELQGLLNWFAKETPLVESYLLPIVTVPSYSGGEMYEHVRNRYRKYRTNLVKLADELKLEGITLTSYVSRHTMAMTLQGNNIPREVISQIMGHSDLKTTNVYLDSFGSSIIDEAVKVL